MKHPVDSYDFKREDTKLDLNSDHIEECISCEGTGIIQLPVDYPCFEIERCCQECEAGRMLAARLADIVSLTLRRNRIKAA